jgi:hypothetical protein
MTQQRRGGWKKDNRGSHPDNLTALLRVLILLDLRFSIQSFKYLILIVV